MEPATAALIARAAIAAGTNKKVWTGIASVLAALCLPVILAVMCYISIASGGTEHNRAAVHLAFDGGEVCDRYLVKSVFYSLYFGADRVRLETDDYKKFADCFVDYEERTQNIEQEDGTVTLGKYTVAVAIGDKTKIFQKLASDYGVTATYEQQSNAVNVWYVAKYDTAAPTEGDEFSDWGGWNGAGDIPVYDLPANGNGSDIVQLALSRLGHPYSQALRGTGNYVDCSYLTLWCYRQIGISLPGTAAEQGRYMVEHNLTVAKESLQPGDLVFWSHKPNGRYMNITHVGIYAGDGMVVDASYSKGNVVYRPLFDNDKQVLYGRPQ